MSGDVVHKIAGRRRAAGFTLVELLVVIGIILVLLAMLVPAVNAMRRSAERKAVQADLTSISVALEEYKKDHGDYPRPTTTERRNHVLVWALIGSPEIAHPFRPKAQPQRTDPEKPDWWDGAPGPGFRTMWNLDATPDKTGSRIWGPYLDPEKFIRSSPDFPNFFKWDMLDRFGSPIEYFPRWKVLPKSPTTAVPVISLFGTNEAVPNAFYDWHQMWTQNPDTATPSVPPVQPDGSIGLAEGTPLHYLRRLMGDTDLDDKITGTEVVTETPPFLLLSRGPLRKFSKKVDVQNKFNKCLEISNLNER